MGRPKGSKNKPKPVKDVVTETPAETTLASDKGAQ